jgi:hypothetical protein
VAAKVGATPVFAEEPGPGINSEVTDARVTLRLPLSSALLAAMAIGGSSCREHF